MNYRDKFNSLNLESQIVCIICGFGSLSVLIAAFVGLFQRGHWAELLVNVLILIALFSITYLTWTRSVQGVGIIFGLLLSVLLAVNFFQFGGSSGYTKFNYYTGLYVIILVYSGRKLIITVTFHVLLLLAIIVLDYLNHPIEKYLFISAEATPTDFWFTIIIISIFTYHLKRLTDTHSRNLSRLNSDLSERIREDMNLKRLLDEKNNELKEAQEHLQHEIDRRSAVLQRKNQSIENFLKINTRELVDPVVQLIDTVQNSKNSSPLFDLLKKSTIELEAISKSIRDAIQSEQPVDRRNIM